MKRFIIILLLIIAIGLSIFAFIIFKDTVFISNNDIINIDVNLDNEEIETTDPYKEGKEIYDNYINNQEETEIIPQTNREQQVIEKDAEYEQTGELPFIYLVDGWQQIFNVLCRRNQKWKQPTLEQKEVDITNLSIDEIFSKSLSQEVETPKIDVDKYLTDNFKSKYNEIEGICGDLFAEDIISVYFDYVTNLLTVYFIRNDTEYEAQYLVDMKIEDEMHKINDIYLQFDSSDIVYQYCDLYDYSPILTLISEKYNPIKINKLYENEELEEDVFVEYDFSKDCIENGIKDKDVCPNLDKGIIEDFSLDDVDDTSYTLKLQVNDNETYYNYFYKYTPKFGKNHSFLDFDVKFIKKLGTNKP